MNRQQCLCRGWIARDAIAAHEKTVQHRAFVDRLLAKFRPEIRA